MPNYELKARVLKENGEYFRAIKDWKKYSYLNSENVEEYHDAYCAMEEFVHDIQSKDKEGFEEAMRILKADNQRLLRLRKRLAFMLNDGKCFFLTLTFTNDVLDSTSEETRRQYVRKFLKANSLFYIANIDFGGQTGREHYHAVVRSDEELPTWEYGFYNYKLIRCSVTSKRKISRYVLKLANHAVKETTKRNYAIYSRLPKGWEETTDEVEETNDQSEEEEVLLDKTYVLRTDYDFTQPFINQFVDSFVENYHSPP